MSSFSRWTKRLFGNPVPRPRTSPRLRSRLDMESLEAREVPATLTWEGTGLNFGTMGNWVGTNNVPVDGDTVVFSQTADSTITQNINGLDLAQISFTNSGNVITLGTTTGLDGTSGDQIVSAANLTNSITGGSLNLINDTAFINLASGSSLSINSQLTGTEGIQLSGGGTLTLSGTAFNTYSGATTINFGSLILNTNTPDFGLSSSITVGNAAGTSDAALLLGSNEEVPNTATVTVRSDGVLFLGAGVAETVGTLNLNNGSTFVFSDVSGATDIINATTVNLTTGAKLIASTVGMSFGNGQVLTIINNTGNAPVGGTFAGMPEGGTVMVNGLPFTISYAGGTGNDVTLTFKGSMTPTTPPAPFYSGATTIPGPNGTSTLVVTGAGVAGGQTTLQLPAGSSAFFADVSGDGVGDVILIVPAGVFVFNGQTGAFFLAFFDSNGDGAKELIRF